MLDGSDPPCIKICDFGFAARLKAAAATETIPSLSSSSAAAAAATAAAADAPPPATPRTAAAQHLERAYTRHIGTAEYMSPELLHPPPSEENLPALASSSGGGGRGRGDGKAGQQQQKRFGYDARSSDIWSAGVFLCVVLLGAFPFEYSKKEVTSLEDAELDLWLQETARAWSDSPFLAANIGALPADARDLLNKIFEVDPSKRITVEGIRAHPWYARPLKEPELAEALERQDAAQRAVDAHIAHRRLDTAKVAARVAALRDLLKEATKPPGREGYSGAGYGYGYGGDGDGGTGQGRRINPLQQLDAGEHWCVVVVFLLIFFSPSHQNALIAHAQPNQPPSTSPSPKKKKKKNIKGSAASTSPRPPCSSTATAAGARETSQGSQEGSSWRPPPQRRTPRSRAAEAWGRRRREEKRRLRLRLRRRRRRRRRRRQRLARAGRTTTTPAKRSGAAGSGAGALPPS